MRHFVQGIISPDEAADLASEVKYLEFTDPRLAGILDAVGARFPVSLEEPAYCRVEHKPGGHPWHVDTGTKGHMAWCRYTAGVLLTEPEVDFTGGGFYFHDAPDDPVFHYCDLVTYDDAPENRHCVASHKGNRRVLIMFFGGKDGTDVRAD